MTMMISVRGARQLDPAIWKVQLSPQEVRFLSAKPFNYGELSILLLAETPFFDKEKGILQFSPTNVHVLNLGASPEAIIIETKTKEIVQPEKQQVKPSIDSLKKGDSDFIKELPPSLKQLGTAILKAVRADFQGELKLFPRSRIYVEAPDNFWAIRPQGRDESFRITVRGTPDSFGNLKSLVLKPDRTGYSYFKVFRLSQIDEFISILHQVRQK